MSTESGSALVHLPERTPDHLLSLAEWNALPEDNSRHWELAEGVLLAVPRPGLAHQWVTTELVSRLDAQLPSDLWPYQQVEIVVLGEEPPTVRVPDIVVVPTSVARMNPARCGAGEVVIAVEVLSPGTRRTDRVTKMSEYAEAGIGHYWLIDLRPPITLTGYELKDGRYFETIRAGGIVTITRPVPLTLDLDTAARLG